MEKKMKVRYITKLGDMEICRTETLEQIAIFLGCHKVHIHKQIKDNGNNTFKYKKNVYKIIDRLEF